MIKSGQKNRNKGGFKMKDRYSLTVRVSQSGNGKIYIAYSGGITALSLKQVIELNIDFNQIEDFNYNSYAIGYKLNDND